MELIREIERFLRSTGTSPARFGREAVRDPRFVFDLRCGRRPRLGTARRVRAFLDRHQGAAGGAK